jgi:hypothetical protein
MQRRHRLRNITRLDYVYNRRDGTKRETHCWWVRFQRAAPDGRRKQNGKTFYDSAYGGKTKALAAAIAWRNANEKLFPTVRNGRGSGRRQAPIGHTLFWEYETEDRHHLNGTMKVEDGVRPVQYRVSVREHGRKKAVAMMRSWCNELRRHLRNDGTLANDATLEAYWNRLGSVRPKARRLPWTS